MAETLTTDYGLVRPADFRGGATIGARSFEDWARAFYCPSIVNPAHLFKAHYAWKILDPKNPQYKIVPKGEHYPCFRKNAELPAVQTGSLCWAYWEDFQGGTGLCYAIEPIFPGEAVMAQAGVGTASIFVGVARRGCDNGVARAVRFINWSDNRTLVLLSSGGSGIAHPWVTLLPTDALAAHMAQAEMLS